MDQQAERAPVPLARAWWMVAALFMLYVLAWLDRLTISMLVAPIKAQLALTDFQMSLVLGPSFALAYAVFGVPLGWAADRFSRRWVIFGGVLVWALATFACGFATTFEGLILARVFVGIGEAALLPSAYSLIGDAFPPGKVTVATSVFQSAGKTGSAVSFGLGGFAIAFAKSLEWIDWPVHGPASYWQITFALIALPGFVLMFLALSFPDPGRRGQGAARPGRAELWGFVRQHGALLGLMTFAFSCMALVGYSLTSWVPTYMERHFGWQPARYGVALSAMNIFGALALIACGRIVDRLYTRGMRDAHLRFYSWTILALSPVIVAAFFVPNPYVFLACYALIQLITVPFIVYGSAIFALLAPSTMRGQLLGMMMFVFNVLGFGAGPAIVGALTDFVFQDQAKIGMSLAVVVIGGAAMGLAAMRLALPRLNAAVAARQSEAR
ncbi:MFS transporter [Novosphingobium sp.]|uniref:MFS transporter n=1 Tax=Novosphingobium sp. TaxID=1874826 RepID=UPI0035B47EFE